MWIRRLRELRGDEWGGYRCCRDVADDRRLTESSICCRPANRFPNQRPHRPGRGIGTARSHGLGKPNIEGPCGCSMSWFIFVLLMEIPDRKAGTEEIRVSYAVDGHCAPRSKCVGRPAPASARGHRPHPLDVQRQAHEVPLAAHLRQASQAESSESEHLLDPPVRRLREPLALRVPGFACGARQFLTHAVRGREPGRVDRHLGLAFTPQRTGKTDAVDQRDCRPVPVLNSF